MKSTSASKTANQVLDLKGSPSIAFNTNRTYTEHGQRIGAIAIDNGVYMADIDRGIHYFLPGCSLTQSAIMAQYDGGKNEHYAPSIVANDYRQQPEIREVVDSLAASVGSTAWKVTA